MNNPTRMISGIVALAGFVVAVVAGLAAENSASVVLTRALTAMLACNLVGSVIGAIAHRTGALHVEQYKQDTPIPAMVVAQAGGGSDESHENKSAA